MESSKLSNAERATPRSNPFKRKVLRVKVGCDFSSVRPAAGRVQRFLKKHGCEESTCLDCELAMVEACNNAIKHTHLQDPIIVEIIIADTEIEMRITDHGPGFTWPKSVNLPKPELESGRGLYLIRRLMDASDYIRGARENVLVLRKKRCAR